MNDESRTEIETSVMTVCNNCGARISIGPGAAVEQPCRDCRAQQIDVTIAGDGLTDEELLQVGKQLRNGTIVPVQIPETVQTVGDFFGENMARSIAEQAWEQMSTKCARCGEAKAFVNAAGVCPECASR